MKTEDPAKPTPEMLRAAWKACAGRPCSSEEDSNRLISEHLWPAMLSAAKMKDKVE